MYLRSRIPGYRGALGFKNQSTSDVDYIQLAVSGQRTLELPVRVAR